jgi:hypothetical protein
MVKAWDIKKAIDKGYKDVRITKPSPYGSAYVCYSGKGAIQAKEFRNAFGSNYLGRVFGLVGERCAYIGTDDTGLALARADAIAHNLRTLGIECYSDFIEKNV